MTFSFVHSALRLWVSYFVLILFVAVSFSQQSASDCQLHAFITFVLYYYVWSAILCFFLCNFQFSVFIGRFALNLSLRKKKLVLRVPVHLDLSLLWACLVSLYQSSYVCLYLSVNFKGCFSSLSVTLNFWEFDLCPSCQVR